MASSSNNEHARRYYATNKERINARRRELYQAKINTTECQKQKKQKVDEPSSSTMAHPENNPPLQLSDSLSSRQTSQINTSMPHCPNPSFTHAFNKFYTNQAHRDFRAKIDKLPLKFPCSICLESYPGIHIRNSNHMYCCSRCISETKGHRLSLSNNMDPGPQPTALTSLSQIEEMLIARVNPILQVTHARSGQYKYSGHTICFPQDITKIADMLPRRVEHLDILIVMRHSNDHKAYDFIFSRHRVLAALGYKLANDPYYKNVRIDTNALASLPAIPTDVSSSLHHSNTTETAVRLPLEPPHELTEDFADPSVDQTSSFVPIIPNTNTEIQEIHHYLHSYNHQSDTRIEWLTIGLLPINEYNIEGLLSMDFPALFPIGAAMPNQRIMKAVQLHEYALHLIRYYDNRFGNHPRFHYYIYNLMMRHRSQATTSFFVKKNFR